MATTNITLDGVNSFTAFGTTGTWSGLNIFNRVFIGIDPGIDPERTMPSTSA